MEQKLAFKKLWKFLISKKLAIVLISALTLVVLGQVLLLARVWDPTAPDTGLQTSRIYSSWWFIIIALALLVNLLTCTANNTYYRFKAGTRNWMLWGSTIFHAGLAIVLIGTLVTGNFRIFCSIKLIQGEPKNIPYQALLTESTTGFDANDKFEIVMHEQKTVVSNNGMDPQTFSTVELTAKNYQPQKIALTESQQLTFRDIYLFPSKYGYAVRLTVQDNQGKVITKQTIPLDTTDYAQGITGYNKKNIVLQPFKEQFNLNFYPNSTKPKLDIAVAGANTPVTAKTISPGELLELQGYKLIFEEVRPWTELLTAYDPGAKLVFTGIILALLGQSLSALFGKPNYPKK